MGHSDMKQRKDSSGTQRAATKVDRLPAHGLSIVGGNKWTTKANDNKNRNAISHGQASVENEIFL